MPLVFIDESLLMPLLEASLLPVLLRAPERLLSVALGDDVDGLVDDVLGAVLSLGDVLLVLGDVLVLGVVLVPGDDESDGLGVVGD